MFRNLNALEIAEGALLADMAVIFQLLYIYIPFPLVADFFRLLVFVVFAVLVLRRGLYVGIMGLCVALFVVSVIVGSYAFFLMLLECTGGLFLGIAMKYRMNLLLTLLIGVTGGALAFYALLLILSLILGVPFSTFVDTLHAIYKSLLALLGVLAAHVGLTDWWRHTLYPGLSSFADTIFRYWWISFYILLWLFLWPVVFVIYVTTNIFVRLLGYEVQPLLGRRVGKLLRYVGRRSIRIAIKRGIVKRRSIRA